MTDARNRGRGWTITLNNYTEEEYNKLKEVAHCHTDKFIFGKEVGKLGTPHIQGYVYFKQPYDFKRVLKILDTPRAHLEKAGGNPLQNYKYCSKDGEFEYKGFEDNRSAVLRSSEKLSEEEILDKIFSRPPVREILRLGINPKTGLSWGMGDDGAPYDE